MITNALEKGMVIKNYRELCKLLNQKECNGNSRKAQLKEFERYFSWEKSGQKYIITEIYDKPLPSKDKRKQGNNSIYVKCIEVLLMSLLATKQGYKYTLSQRQWWLTLGMINNKYGYNTTEKQLELIELDPVITTYEINTFYDRTHRKLSDIFRSALKSLKNRKLIDFNYKTIVVRENEHIFFDDGDDDHVYEEANDYTLYKILETEKEVLEEMGYDKFIQVQLRYKTNQYYNRVKELLYERYGITNYYKQIEIIYTQKHIIKALPDVERELEKELLNTQIVDVLNKQAEKIYKKNEEDFFMEKSDFYPPSNYVLAQKLLTSALIQIKKSDAE